MRILSALIVFSVSLLPLAAQWLHRPTPGIPRTADGKPNLSAPAPRTADGKPDLTGLWNTLNSVADYKPGEAKPWVQKLVQQRKENFDRDNPVFQCLPLGPGYSTKLVFAKRIYQTPGLIIVLHDDLTWRQIFMDGRPLVTDSYATWMGYSVGHWEGDTLVVESSGFNDRTWLADRYPHTEALRMTERYRRTDFGHLDLDVTFEDPEAYSQPWKARVSALLAPDTEIIEGYCDNSQSGPQDWVGKVSDAARSAVKVDPEVLETLTGVYKGFWGGRPRRVEVNFSGGALSVGVDGKEPETLVPQSPTRFIAESGYLYEFVRNDRGIATYMIESHVTGDYKYERQQ